MKKKIVKGNIISITKDNVLIDVGLKSEGKIPTSEFNRLGTESEIKVGDIVEVYVDNLDDNNGEIRLSREKALKQSSWNELEKSFKDGKKNYWSAF